MTGILSVLNVGAGDIRVTFNQHDRGERDKALAMLQDMQKRGYAILVQLDDGTYVRAKEIDAARGCYIVQLPDGGSHEAAEPVEPAPKRRGRPRKVAIPVTKARATGVARSAGG